MVSEHGSRYVKGCQCEKCSLARQRARDYARTKARDANPTAKRRAYKTAKQREYDAKLSPDQLEARRARDRARYRIAHPEQPKRPKSQAKTTAERRHGGPDEWARMWESQGGLCYLCLRPLAADKRGVHVDHDHSCCDPGPRGRSTDSCAYCRRGLTHERCNQIWGLAREDPELLVTMAEQGMRVKLETEQRISTKAEQLTIDALSA